MASVFVVLQSLPSAARVFWLGEGKVQETTTTRVCNKIHSTLGAAVRTECVCSSNRVEKKVARASISHFTFSFLKKVRGIIYASSRSSSALLNEHPVR